MYLGGPVEQNRLYYIHTHAELPDSLLIRDGVFWGGDFTHLVRMLNSGDILQDEVRFFAGYSGWDTGQLESELEENSWMVGQISGEGIFTGLRMDCGKNRCRNWGEDTRYGRISRKIRL